MEKYFFIFTGVITLVCMFGFLNEKLTKLTYEIALMLFSAVFGLLMLFGAMILGQADVKALVKESHLINIEEFLMEGVLCFMLFAGSCHLKLSDFIKQARQITVLSFVCTLLGAGFYGFMFYGAALLLGLNLSLPVCLMFGSIIAPTDPIAATGILSKFGLPKGISFLIEGESLFNDGVGVALFVCFSGMVSSNTAGNFFGVMFRELFGAMLVGAVVTVVCFIFYKYTKSRTLGIFFSLMAVSLCYAICEVLDFSGAIASVVCGILFAALRTHYCVEDDPLKAKAYDSFWETLDVLLNSLLYVMLGLSFANILQMHHVVILSLIAIAANLIARAGSLSLSTLIMGKLPDSYNKLSFIKLLTWGGLRGGLCIALAMSTKQLVPENTYYIILGGTYAIVFFTTVVQGLTMKSVYKRIDRKLHQ